MASLEYEWNDKKQKWKITPEKESHIGRDLNQFVSFSDISKSGSEVFAYVSQIYTKS